MNRRLALEWGDGRADALHQSRTHAILWASQASDIGESTVPQPKDIDESSGLHIQAKQDYEQVQRQALLRHLWGNLTGQHDDLVPFEDLRKTLGLLSQQYRGVQPVPLDRIIGSIGRSTDFDRVFLPLQRHSRGKWLSVDAAYLGGVNLPPVSLYKVGDAYFVVDGHHRVSVARQQGQTFIDAEVNELQSRVPVTADLRLEDLDALQAYRAFLEQTKLDVLRPEQSILLTMPGDYVKLLDHIRVHKYFVDRAETRSLSAEEAVTHWYDSVYLPLVHAIRKDKLLQDFAGHTEADLYLWVIEHAYYLSQELKQQLAPWEVARDFARRFGHGPRRWWERTKRRALDILVPRPFESGPRPGAWREERLAQGEHTHLFRDILVTLAGTETGWRALTQAAIFAHSEESVLRGLHVAATNSEEALANGREVLAEFARRCKELGTNCTSSLVVGDVAQEIIARARWADLVVVNQRREHGRLAERPLGTIFQLVAGQAGRPLLVVPGTEVLPLRRVVLAYDGSDKSREALFVLRHLATCWRIQSTILAVDGGNQGRGLVDSAVRYIQEAGGATPGTRLEQGPVEEAILRVMEDEGAELLVMGGYGYQPLLKMVLGSTVDRVLRVAWFPVLICR